MDASQLLDTVYTVLGTCANWTQTLLSASWMETYLSGERLKMKGGCNTRRRRRGGEGLGEEKSSVLAHWKRTANIMSSGRNGRVLNQMGKLRNLIFFCMY